MTNGTIEYDTHAVDTLTQINTNRWLEIQISCIHCVNVYGGSQYKIPVVFIQNIKWLPTKNVTQNT